MMNKSIWLPRFTVLPALLLVLAGCPDPNTGGGEGTGEGVRAAQLSVGLSGTAKSGTVSYAVQVDGGPSEISAFGLDINFDPAVLTYKGWEKGDLTGSFTQVGANNIDEDTVRVGGFSVDGSVPAGATGSLAIIQFEATGNAPDSLSITEAMDHIKGFSTGQ